MTTLNHACPEDVFAQGACAANAQIGSAKAETPALAAPLAGPVILVKPAASPLPELVIDLHGPIALRLPVTVGFGAGGRLQSTLDGLPDTALSRFTLTLAGGPDGLLSNARDLCSGADRARRRGLRRPERRDLELVGDPADRGLQAAGQGHAQGPAPPPPGARAALHGAAGPAADARSA